MYQPLLKFFPVGALVALLTFVSTYGIAQAPANDECAGATAFATIPFHATQNTRLATQNAGDPPLTCNVDNSGNTGLNGKTVWYQYTAASTQWVKFSTIGSGPDSTYDTVLGLFTGTCGSLTEVGCNDDSVNGTIRQSVLYYYVQSGVTYTVLVAEWNGGGVSGGMPTGGDLVFDVFAAIPPPLVLGPKAGSLANGVIVSTNGFGNAPMSVEQ